MSSLWALALAPKAALSRAAARFSRTRWSRRCIPPFARHYGVSWDEASVPPGGFGSLQEFFCRELKPGLRPVAADPAAIVSPVDGRFGACGQIERGTLLQAKGRDYTVADLLEDSTHGFHGGLYLTLYLAPPDYHRIHAPLSGEVVAARYIPGTHWPVHAAAVAAIPRLFAINERLVTYIRSENTEAALVMVGACIVGGLKVNYDTGIGRHPHDRIRQYAGGIPISRGAELGRFEFGSTVVLLLAGEPLRLDPSVCPGAAVRMGAPIAGQAPPRGPA